MSSDVYMKKWLGALTQPWRRERVKTPYCPELVRQLKNELKEGGQKNRNLKRQKFNLYPQNEYLDIHTKRASLKASSSVVFLESYYGEETIHNCSGFILESDNDSSIVLTTLNVFKHPRSKKIEIKDIKVTVHLPNGRSFDGEMEAYDLHFNVAAIKIQSDIPLPAASLVYLSDYIAVNPNHHFTEEDLYQHHPNSSCFDLIPGDAVIALSRSPRKPYSIMAAPGVFSIDRSHYKSKELFTASCKIPKCGIGGPLINRFGDVIGISLHKDVHMTFLPINIASIWWENYKKYSQTRRPSLGMEVANLYAARLEILDRIQRKFPDTKKGVIVEEVETGSSVDLAVIKYNDVIIQIDGEEIRSILELYGYMWTKLGKSVELLVVRASDDVTLRLNMVLDAA